MPDEQGNLLPGDEGYVAPAETQVAEAPGVVTEETPVDGTTKTLTSAEAGALNLQARVPVEVTQESYDKLLSAYIALKQRLALDPIIEKQFDAQAGLI